ncbi:MAG: DUF305 domain-containing protein [Trueperaceae bacterium]|nr:DUF305 domain-containing protein [Trueperaceae bacterium]
MTDTTSAGAKLTPVVKRTLLILVIATLVVWIAVATRLPERGGIVDSGDHTGTAEHAVTEQPSTGHTAAGHATSHATVGSEAEFIAAMIPHHQEAVDSANALLLISERPEIRSLTQDVIVAQTAEIARLEGWLSAFYPDQGAYQDYQSMMRSTVGMSVEQAEVAFMEDMILHHEMAVDMAQAYLALSTPRRPEVQALATAVVSTQSQEVEAMRAWLAQHEEVGHDGH